jgi:glucose dehydrogenase
VTSYFDNGDIHQYNSLRPLAAGLLFSILSLASSGTAQVTHSDLVKPDPSNWLSYSGSYDSRRHTPLKQIDTTNVGKLLATWAFHVPGSQGLEGVPAVVNSIMYVAKASGVIALDARSGRLGRHKLGRGGLQVFRGS